MSLAPDRLERFARHIVLPEIGGAGQARLTKAHVILVGLGGIGSPALQYLAGAGTGSFTLIDDGKVEASNLQRQTIYREADIGCEKVAAGGCWLDSFDPAIEANRVVRKLDRDTAPATLSGADLVLDGTDNFATRLAVSDACVALGVPLLSAAVGRFQGQVGAFAGHLADQPCYRCFVGDAFDAERIATPVPKMGCWARWPAGSAPSRPCRRCACCSPRLAEMGEAMWGRLHLLEGLQPGMRTLTIAKDSACKACGSGAT